MTALLRWIGGLATRFPRAVVAAAVALVAVAAPLGGGVADLLTSGGFDDPGAESGRADAVLAEQFGVRSPNLVLVVTARAGTVDDPAVAAAGRALTGELAAADQVTDVVSYWAVPDGTGLRSENGTRAMILARIDGDEDQIAARVVTIGPRFAQSDPAGPIEVRVGGSAEVSHEVDVTIGEDLVRAELIAMPIALILLILAFGSVVAALLPLMTAVVSVVGTFLMLRVLVALTDVSVYSLNLTVALGLGLAIDYSLLMVYRHRDELRAGHDPRQAALRTVRTAGRTVAFSALTVAVALLTLLVFPFTFLRSMAFAGVCVTALAGVFSVVLLPAVLVLLGHRVNALTLWRHSVNPPEQGVWHHVGTFVMRRPVRVTLAAVGLLLVLGSPFLGITLTSVDDRVLPASSNARQVNDIVRDDFAGPTGTLSVVAPDTGGDLSGLDGYAARLAELPGVARVDAATGTYCGPDAAPALGCAAGQLVITPDRSAGYAAFTTSVGTYLSVVPAVEPLSPAGQDLVRDVRAVEAPWPVLVTGESAALVDANDALLTRLPWAVGLIVVVTAVLLFGMFGSVVVPAKAIVLNVLSLCATFGAMVWVFQDGHLSGPLDFTATGGLNAAILVLMFCVAFGLSMDYEVMLLSRIKEEYDHGVGNERSVTFGLQRVGRILTAAALLISVVMIAFGTSRVSFIKMFGVGMTVAVLTDAFLIRGTLVPAVMRLAGDRNWWAPGPLRRLHARWGIRESAEPVLEPAEHDAPGAGRHVPPHRPPGTGAQHLRQPPPRRERSRSAGRHRRPAATRQPRHLSRPTRRPLVVGALIGGILTAGAVVVAALTQI